jgi:pimeloyl-ACP methyl ester carboxylesterase
MISVCGLKAAKWIACWQIPALLKKFEPDARDIVELIEPGDHVVGFSYGGVVALLAAAERSDDIASLTVIEPPALDVARGDEDVERLVDDLVSTLSMDAPLVTKLEAFAELIVIPGPPMDPLPPPIEQGARMLMSCRRPWEARIPVSELRTASFPKLVVSGEGNPGLIKVCDALEEQLAAERAHVPGNGHMIPFVPSFNDVLGDFLERASA